LSIESCSSTENDRFIINMSVFLSRYVFSFIKILFETIFDSRKQKKSSSNRIFLYYRWKWNVFRNEEKREESTTKVTVDSQVV